METKKIESEQQKCKSCGGNLFYSPKTKNLVCEKCGISKEIVVNNEINRHNLNEKIGVSKEYKEYIEQNKSFKCPNCGANVVLSKYEISHVCPYCSTPLVINNKNSYGLKPDAIIPFDFNENDASEIFAKAVRKKFFAPRQFKKKIPENQITGIYIPCFGFDANTKSVYSGELYENETERDSNGSTHTRRRYFHVSGKWNYRYENIMVECSSQITQTELKGFTPFRYDNEKPFNNSFILGYSVEQYDKEVGDCIEQYNYELKNCIRNDILRKYNYDGVSYLNVKTDKSDEKYMYHILPVYKFEYNYKNKKYVTYMNGQTGKVDNNIPKSKLKIAIAVLLPILIFAIPFIISIISSMLSN